MQNSDPSYASEYNREKLLTKVISVLPLLKSRQGTKLATTVLQLFYLAKAADVPLWVKCTVITALGYFIVVPDAIPDVTPVVGFVDDLGVLASALAAVAPYISPTIKKRVEETLISLKLRTRSKTTDVPIM
ncbi:hypothetical protein A9Q81_18625 [Gammaproteobacteria bacterium 42_54_T18]|nr:hypothetical protein A9Q81_18625 [Gammaproteobacteria bacterium 42_54_T18]